MPGLSGFDVLSHLEPSNTPYVIFVTAFDRYAIRAFEVRAIDWLYKTWLPRSGFVPDDQPAFEAWIGRPFAHGLEHFEIACQLPVKSAWIPRGGRSDSSGSD